MNFQFISDTETIRCSKCGEIEILCHHSTVKKYIKTLDKENQIKGIWIPVLKYKCEKCGKISSSQHSSVDKGRRYDKKLIRYIQAMYDKYNKSALAVHCLFQERKSTYIPISTIYDIANERK